MRSRTLFMVLGLCAALLIAAGWLGLSMPIRPGSHRDEVLAVLRRRQIDPVSVELQNGCAPSIERCRTYAATVTIVTSKTLTGRIDCRTRWTGCTLTVPAARIYAEPLRDVISPLVERWSELRGGLLSWLRQIGRQ
jgi:hypothetical protein